MAEKDDIKARIKQTDPKAARFLNELDKELLNTGYRGAVVTTNESMTSDEEEMALYEGFLREGYLPQEASQKAKEWLAAKSRFCG